MNKLISDLATQGIHFFNETLDPSAAKDLYEALLKFRDFDGSLFMSKKEYDLQTNHLNANPTKEFNILNTFEDQLAFVEQEEVVTTALSQVLGDDYEIVLKKLVCGVPESWMPEWVREKTKGVNVANLGPYIKKEFRDVTYFRGIDFHQDIIDWPSGSTDLDPSTFLTLYVYLHEVDEFDSPLHVLPNSHKLGATLFPHQLRNTGGSEWHYTNDIGDSMSCDDFVLTGPAGYAAIWHNCTLHGTQPVKHESEKFRISLRYLIGKSNDNKNQTGIDEINNSISGELRPIRTRQDLDTDGKALITGNIINKY